MKYLEQGSVPNCDPMVRNVPLGSKNYEMIDGLLHEDPTCPGRWHLVVPRKLRQQLLEEAHAGIFAGHFSEKVYDNGWRHSLDRTSIQPPLPGSL